ncbi:thioesterase domain-containing protein [Phlyctema vagabunda]|uniref:Thioesterase domain-containing protein n=1 Tax=Phlyctema vagabunda TaxID=108571 RepID=A0ABR4PB44_9HELO
MDTSRLCTLIHAGPAGTRRAPLVLLHDGGGTIFSYFLLKAPNCAVYGIHNPRTQPPQDWEGGLPQMALEYLTVLKKRFQNRPILLGGWSLGGLVALEISRIVADQPIESRLNIKGLVMIDSVFPHPTLPAHIKSVPFQVDWDEHVKSDVKATVQYAMEQTDRLIETWQLPTWIPNPNDSLMTNGAVHGTVKTLSPPPAILLRAREAAPPPPQATEGVEDVNDIDLCRSKRFLGWEEYEPKFIRNVLDINGHHHNIFDEKNIASLNAKLKIACRALDIST